METTTFRDRRHAGEQLGRALGGYRSADAVVFGLPRGGVVVAEMVADALGDPLDILVARKIGHPGNPEFAIGAITGDGLVAMNLQEATAIPPEWLRSERFAQHQEARLQRHRYMDERAPIPVEGKVAILVDDGIATGYTMEAAVITIRRRGPARIVVAAPVAPQLTVERFASLADDVVTLQSPDYMAAVSLWYEDFAPVQDEVVRAIMDRHAPAADPGVVD